MMVGIRRQFSESARNLSKVYNIDLHERGFEVSKIPMKSLLFITAAAAAVLFSSCNTMIGVGRDMRMGGEGLENSATKANGGGSSGGGDTSGAPVY